MQLFSALCTVLFATSILALPPACQPSPTSINPQDLLDVVTIQTDLWRTDIEHVNAFINNTIPTQNGLENQKLHDAASDILNNFDLIHNLGCMINILPTPIAGSDAVSATMPIQLLPFLQDFTNILSDIVNSNGQTYCIAGAPCFSEVIKSTKTDPRRSMGETYCTILGMTAIFWEAFIDDNGLKDIATAQGKVLTPPQGPLPCPVFTSNSTVSTYLFEEDLQ